MRRINVLIFGNVQGIFFRTNIKRVALDLGLKGYVRNSNEEVEAVFEGEEAKIEKILEFCRIGPIGAEVNKIEIKEEEFKGEFDDFKIED